MLQTLAQILVQYFHSVQKKLSIGWSGKIRGQYYNVLDLGLIVPSMIKAQYQSTFASVPTVDIISSPFSLQRGTRLGSPLLPLLFFVYLSNLYYKA